MEPIYEGICRKMDDTLVVELIGQDGIDSLSYNLEGETEILNALAKYNDIEDPHTLGTKISNPQVMALVKEIDGEYELAVDEMQE